MAYRKFSMGDTAGAITTSLNIVNDPYFPEVVCRIDQLTAVERSEAVGECQRTPPNVGGGAGLRSAMPILRWYVYAQRNPWAYAVAAASLVGLPYFLGYLHGRART